MKTTTRTTAAYRMGKTIEEQNEKIKELEYKIESIKRHVTSRAATSKQLMIEAEERRDQHGRTFHSSSYTELSWLLELQFKMSETEVIDTVEEYRIRMNERNKN